MKFLGKLILCILIPMSLPYTVGVYYSLLGNRDVEQQWLDEVINHLKLERAICKDREKKEALDYCIQRYNKIGAWDVSIMPLIQADGCNLPWCPGLTIDPEVMLYPIHDGAMVVLHESLHDGWFNMHPFIDAKMERIGCL